MIELGNREQELPDSLFGTAFRVNDHSSSASESLSSRFGFKGRMFGFLTGLSLMPGRKCALIGSHSVTACHGVA